MASFDSDIFGKVSMPASFSGLMRLIHSVDYVHMWRGQADIRWPVHSAAYRRVMQTTHGPVSESALRYYEERLLERATHRGFRYHDGRRLSDFELLARLQHHGAATRLVDFSRSVLVGLYFAASSNPDNVGLLLGLHSHYLGGYEELPEERPYEEILDDIKDLEYPQTWEPPVVSARIAAQHAQFLYSTVSTDRKGSLWIDKKDDAYVAIAISPAVKRESLDILSSLYDIRHLTLFPDIDGFGYANSQRFGPYSNSRW